MKILLLGKDGQVGWELQRSLAVLGDMHAYGREECDVSDLQGLRDLIKQLRPDVIVNAAAYTAVDKAESETTLAVCLNAAVPKVLAEEAKNSGALLVHFSTDYVFDGAKTDPYTESDHAKPLSTYGLTKWQGEEAIAKSGCQHLIFRTSWVFAARGVNFAKTMLRLAGERQELKVVGDQYGAPTSAELIADVTAHCIKACVNKASKTEGNDLSGIYHLTASSATTWHAYAQYVIGYAVESGVVLQCGVADIRAIPAADYPAPAKRPANSRLDTSKLQTTFDLKMPPWQCHVRRMLDEVLPEKTGERKA